MTLEVRAAGASDPGQVRDNNEDSLLVGSRIFAVADGLGGHQAGEVASALAIETLQSLDQTSIGEAVKRLEETVLRANRLVYEESKRDPEKAGMGTTITAIIVDDASAHLAHVGDSRAYLVRGDRVEQLTEDHTVVGRMVTEGLLTQEAAEEHPQRSVLTRAIGTGRSVDVDVTHVPLRGGDRLLLCSDGLTAVLSQYELVRLVGASAGDDLDTICESLVAEANRRGAPDNVTIVLVQVEGTPSGDDGAGGGGARAVARRRRSTPAMRRLPRRSIVWLAIIAIALTASIIGVRRWVGSSYFVGVHDGQITIFHGVPVTVPVFTYQEVEEPTGIPTGRVQAFQLEELEQGIVKASLEEARAYVEDVLCEQLTPPKPRPAICPVQRSDGP